MRKDAPVRAYQCSEERRPHSAAGCFLAATIDEKFWKEEQLITRQPELWSCRNVCLLDPVKASESNRRSPHDQYASGSRRSHTGRSRAVAVEHCERSA